MANTFVWILTIAVISTGIIWCFDKCKLAPARRRKPAEIQLKTEQANNEKALPNVAKPASWIETAASVFPVLAVVFIVRSFIFEPFQIPSGSMMPTLLIGDFILVQKFAYGIKNPLTQTTLIPNGHPQRGDIAVFKFPKNPSVDYIKRVIGLPGDRITYKTENKTVTVYPACSSNQPCNKVPITYSDVQPSHFIQTFIGYADSEYGNGFFDVPLGESLKGGLRLALRNETLDDVTHSILLLPEAQNPPKMFDNPPGQSQASWVVPQGHYFMMGDNRDNSEDSRYWGFVPEKNLVGKAIAVWMSFDKQEGKWPTGVRLSHIGKIH